MHKCILLHVLTEAEYVKQKLKVCFSHEQCKRLLFKFSHYMLQMQKFQLFLLHTNEALY